MARKTTRRKNSRKQSKSKISTKIGFSGRQAAFFALVFAVIVGFFIWRSFAASPLQTIEAEQMVLAGNATRQTPPANADYQVSGGQFVSLVSPASTVSTTFYSTADVSSLGVTVRATSSTCRYYNNLKVTVDGVKLLGGDIIPTTSWKTVTPSPAIPIHGKMSHLLVISRTPTSTAGACSLGLLVDKIDLNGNAPKAPSVVISASPSTVMDGQTTTLTWNSINTTGVCTAGGDWSGGKNQNGSAATTALAAAHKAYSYSLTCSGPAGVVYGSTTVNVVPNASLLGLPSATTLSRSAATGNPAPTSIGSTGATLWAAISPNSPLAAGATNYYFQYVHCKANNPAPLFGGATGGCTVSGSSGWISTPLLPASSGTAPIRISYNLTGLSSGTAYMYRLVAVNPVGSATDRGYLTVSDTAVVTAAGTQSFYTAKLTLGGG